MSSLSPLFAFLIFSASSRVPDLAMVPMLSITSFRLIPMPWSWIVSVRASGSASSRMESSAPSSRSSGFVSASKRSRSVASEAFEISSRRKMSLCE